MPNDANTLRGAVEALAALRTAYRRYIASPRPESWERCERAHDAAVAALRAQEVVEIIGPRVTQAIGDGNASPSEAALRLNDAPSGVVDFERRLGTKLGFSDRELAGYMRAARRALRNASDGRAEVAPIRTPDDLIEQLEHVKATVAHVFDTTKRGVSHKVKRAERRETRRFMLQRLYLVGSVVINAGHAPVFAYSYAVSLGVSAVQLRGRRVRPPVRARLNASRAWSGAA